ncbi:MAG: TolC family protein [Gemmataceae bacterium]
MKFGSFVIAVACAWTGLAAAEDRAVSFHDVLRVALEKSPDVGKIAASQSGRMADATSTEVKQNPLLDAEYGAPTNGMHEKDEFGLKVAQPLRPSDFGARTRLAALIRDSATLERKVELLEFGQNLAVTYAKAWAVQERRGILEKARRLAEDIFAKLREGAAKGFLAEGDAAVFEGEVALLATDIVGAEADRKAAVAELIKVSGADLSGARLLPPPEARLPSTADVLAKARGGELPAQRRAELAAKIATRQVELARLDSYPRFGPSVGYSRTDAGDRQVTFGFSVELPFFDRNQAGRMRALGEEQAARRLQEYATSGRLEEAAVLLFDAATALTTQRRKFEREVIPARERALRGFRKQFDAGQGTPFLVAQAQRELAESRLRALDLWSLERAALAQLSILLGNEL